MITLKKKLPITRKEIQELEIYRETKIRDEEDILVKYVATSSIDPSFRAFTYAKDLDAAYSSLYIDYELFLQKKNIQMPFAKHLR